MKAVKTSKNILSKKNTSPEFIVVETSERNHVVARLQIGTKFKYNAWATCRNRAQAERLTLLLNAQHLETPC